MYPASMRWWKKGEQLNNMREITSSEQFSDALSVAVEQDKLVLVDFYSTGCGSCKAIYPKVKCQFSALLSAILKEIYYLYLYLSRNLEIFGQFHYYGLQNICLICFAKLLAIFIPQK